MSSVTLRNAIRLLLSSHPAVKVSEAGHAGYIERYRTMTGSNIGLETRGDRHQNLFVEAAAIRLSLLADIPHESYAAAGYRTTRPNSNLFHQDAFGDDDIVRFMLADLWQAARVVAEVAGMGARR